MPDRERGETLLELLIAVLVFGVAVVAIIGAFSSSFLMSNVHRQQASAGTLLRNYAEAIEGGTYVPCATTTDFPVVVESGYTKSVVKVRYGTGAGWTDTRCTPATADDKGVLQLTLQVTSPGPSNLASEQLTIVVRKR